MTPLTIASVNTRFLFHLYLQVALNAIKRVVRVLLMINAFVDYVILHQSSVIFKFL